MKGVLEALPIRYEDYTFIDLGSGTGRVLLMASEFPFRKIIGVEFCPPVRERALENLRRYRSSSQRCRNFEILLQDARLFAVPDEPVVVFLSHPFRVESLFQGVLENLKMSLMTAPRQIYFIYYIPTFSGMIRNCGFLEKIHVQPHCDIYRNTVWTKQMAHAGIASHANT
jgi:SAM-dependent methyltransferase